MSRTALVAALLAPTLAAAQPAPATHPDAPRQAAPSTVAPAAPKGELAALLAEADAAYRHRDEPGQLKAVGERLAEAERLAPADYEVLWRLARLNFWRADDPDLDKKEKSRFGKLAWDYGDRATVANPARVEGWHYAAAGVGNYALGIGIITALRKGIEGKFKDRLSHAERIDPDFEDGAIQTAWGRFWFELPWPKYSADRARKSLEEALRKNPANVRAHVYLADVHEKEGRTEQAAQELRAALDGPPGRYDAAEEKRWQEVARRMIAAR